MSDSKKQAYHNFDMTLEECRRVFDSIDGLVVVDGLGKIKYLSPQMIENIESIEGGAVTSQLVGKHIEEVHPTSKIGTVLHTGLEQRECFYFIGGVTNIARIKPLKKGTELVGAIDYDLFDDDADLRRFFDKLVELSMSGVIDLKESIGAILKKYKGSKKLKYQISSIIGESPQILEVKKKIYDIAESNSTVLIMGETGCGKEIVAHSIHNISRRKFEPMIEINCSAIPESLFESELFGYEEGTFTGAQKGGKAGKFELADKGTIFLDEVDQLPYHIQPKLLRVLQEKEVSRIGSNSRPIDVRVIAATNKNLKELMEKNLFREDLYYRLNVIDITIPPLSQRTQDIPLLVDSHIKKMNQLLYKNVSGISSEAVKLFYDYHWPGNVRELFNMIERAMNVCDGTVLRLQDFGDFFSMKGKHEGNEPTFSQGGSSFIAVSEESPLEKVRDLAEREAIISALATCRGNKSKAADLLKISRPCLYYKMKKNQIML